MSAPENHEIRIQGDAAPPGRNRLGPVLLAIAGLALALLGTFPPQAWVWPAPSVPAWLLALLDWSFLGITAVATLLALAVAILIIWVGRRPLPKDMKKLLAAGGLGWRDALLMMIATAIGIAMAMMLLRLHERGGGVATDAEQVEAVPPPQPGGVSLAWSWTSETAQWLFDLLFPVFSIVLVVVGFVCFVMMMLARARARAEGQAREKADPLEGAIAAAADESLEDLETGGDPRAAIIRCYARFERSLAAAETARAPWQTPIEFMRVALAALPLPARDVERLTDLFERARFGPHVMDAADREAALQALAAIRSTLAARDPDAAAD